MFAPTDKGNAELKSPGTSLPAAELQILILLDGKATVGEIGKMASNLTPTEVSDILRKFFAAALITTATEPTSDGLESGFFSIAVPVIMLTAEATRESVLKGLLGGADGYVTKPFEHDMLIQAVKAVLGLTGEKEAKPEAKPAAKPG